MADTSSMTAQTIVDVCRENIAAIAESLNQCFDAQHELAVEDPADWSSDDVPAELDGPGLLIRCSAGETSWLCAIPAALPLPDWYTDPSESQRARLDTLAVEWATNLLPPQIECDKHSNTTAANLQSEIAQSATTAEATVLPISVDEQEGHLWIIGPLPATAGGDDLEKEAAPVADHAEAIPAQKPNPSATSARTAPRPTADPLARIRGISVPVIVKLAERRIEIEELLHLCPGTIVSFDKPCEDLLDLMINNRPYARGEAVKIGEKFGIKVSEVGYVPHREPRIIS